MVEIFWITIITAHCSIVKNETMMKETVERGIKAVVFDYGGVIELTPGSGGGVLRAIAESLSVPFEIFQKEYFKRNHLSNVGNISWDDVLLQVVAVFDAREAAGKRALSILEDFRSRLRVNKELVDIFPLLRQKGFKVGIFSNYRESLRGRLREQGILEQVDEVVVSGEIGFQKPQKEAFEALFKTLKVLPKQVIFIDDTPRSLETAGEIGYTPILFRDNAQLKNELRKLGINL